jgi:beta-galactosidase
MKSVKLTSICLAVVAYVFVACTEKPTRTVEAFDNNWKFSLIADSTAIDPAFADADWRALNLPHDWSIEGNFDEKNPSGTGGGALPGGIGWYRKSFITPESYTDKKVFVEFDGVYRNSDVWINGTHLGYRPNGYISFRYELTPYLKNDGTSNVLVVKADNSKQPNSRWYSGSGIYRHVRVVAVNPVHIDQWGTYVTTPVVTAESATVQLETDIRNTSNQSIHVVVKTTIVDPSGKKIAESKAELQEIGANNSGKTNQNFSIASPLLWSVESPNLYKSITQLIVNNEVVDEYETIFGIRFFDFDASAGFSLNGKPLKILGVCLHHDLGALGTAVNTRAIERQLAIMQGMGVNTIRTSHNPPTPELLDLCDQMGFLVMNEMFDMWKLKKSEFDYSLDWDGWHKKDLQDFILRDRNHPSVIVWSIGNEIIEQYNAADSSGSVIARELKSLVHELDSTRPVTAANNHPYASNPLIRSEALDLIGYNYHHEMYETFPTDFPGKKFIATETTSALATRGHYDMPSDSIRRWPIAWDKPFVEGNPDNTVSAYDNVSAPWGSTHEETWKVVKKHPHISGMFIWTGFDYLGEPTPYGWPSRSSYFGVVDLAGFPKDAYYMYQSEWTNTPVLHVFPHWNWSEGQTIDVWAYYNQADEVELFLNGKSLGTKKKLNDDLHVQWRVPFEAGTLKAVSRKVGKEVLVKEVKTAGKAANIVLEADRSTIAADGNDLSFVTIKITDEAGNLVPDADNFITFDVKGEGYIAAVDNGNPVSHESFRGNSRKAFNGLALLIIQSTTRKGQVEVTASSAGLREGRISVIVK